MTNWRLLIHVISAVSSVPVGKTPGQLGAWLRQELMKRDYDLQRGGQSRFAREADLHPSIVNRILKEDRGAEVDVLRRMGAALGYSLGEMLVFAGSAEPGELLVRSSEDLEDVSSNPYTDPSERKIWEIRGLSEFIRRQLIYVVRAAIKSEAEEDSRPSADVRSIRKPS